MLNNKFQQYTKKTLTELKHEIEAQRSMAKREADQNWRCVRSRGTFLATKDRQGQCSPCPEAEAIQWRGTAKEIVSLIRHVRENYPGMGIEVYIAGGYDGAENMVEMFDGVYEPWVSSWEVSVWKEGAI